MDWTGFVHTRLNSFDQPDSRTPRTRDNLQKHPVEPKPGPRKLHAGPRTTQLGAAPQPSPSPATHTPHVTRSSSPSLSDLKFTPAHTTLSTRQESGQEQHQPEAFPRESIRKQASNSTRERSSASTGFLAQERMHQSTLNHIHKCSSIRKHWALQQRVSHSPAIT